MCVQAAAFPSCCETPQGELKQTGANGNRIRAQHFYGNSSSVQPEEKQERQSLSGEDGPDLA